MDITMLTELMDKDLRKSGAYDRYPVRFFSMKYERGVSDTLIQIKKFLNTVDFFDINDLLPHEDGWITTDSFRKVLYGLEPKKSFIVVGFSEYARFLGESEFLSLLMSLWEMENPVDSHKRRIYIPCFALYSQIKKLVGIHHRRIKTYNPLLNETDVEDLPRIFFVNDGLNANFCSNEVVNSKEWFGMWRNLDIDTEKPIICSSKTLSYFYTSASPDNVYNIQFIENYKDMLKHMYQIDNLYDCKKNSEEYYRRLFNIVKIMGGKRVEDIILSEINVQSIDILNIYSLWKISDTFKRWLIQNYVFISLQENTYLYKVMCCMEDLSDRELLEKIYLVIFEEKDNSLCEERKQILITVKKVEKDITFSNRMIEYYSSLVRRLVQKKTAVSMESIDFTKDDKILIEKRDVLKPVIGEEVVPYLTCFSRYERQLIIWLFRIDFIGEEWLKDYYPDLWYYLSGAEIDIEPKNFAEKFEEYFKGYRTLRLGHGTGSIYDIAINAWNKNETVFYAWYFDSLIEYPEVYLKRNKFQGRVYVLDGVGAEFMGYILKILESKGYWAECSSYTKCHLPSTTSIAKEFYPPEYKWIEDYDSKVIHGGTYYHVQNLESSLSEIKTIIDRIVDDDEEGIFAITADHGSTVGHKIQKRNKKYNFDQSEHDGRCYCNKGKQQIESSEDYVVYDDEAGRQWVIALNQQSLYNNSKYAVHGGATPEEVLVPVIIVHRGQNNIKHYRVKAVNLKVSGINRKIEVKINPIPTDIKVILKAKDGTDVEMELNSDANVWVGELKRGIEQDIEIIVDSQISNFRTIPQTKMGDDLFDD